MFPLTSAMIFLASCHFWHSPLPFPHHFVACRFFPVLPGSSSFRDFSAPKHVGHLQIVVNTLIIHYFLLSALTFLLYSLFLRFRRCFLFFFRLLSWPSCPVRELTRPQICDIFRFSPLWVDLSKKHPGTLLHTCGQHSGRAR